MCTACNLRTLEYNQLNLSEKHANLSKLKKYFIRLTRAIKNITFDM